MQVLHCWPVNYGVFVAFWVVGSVGYWGSERKLQLTNCSCSLTAVTPPPQKQSYTAWSEAKLQNPQISVLSNFCAEHRCAASILVNINSIILLSKSAPEEPIILQGISLSGPQHHIFTAQPILPRIQFRARVGSAPSTTISVNCQEYLHSQRADSSCILLYDWHII